LIKKYFTNKVPHPTSKSALYYTTLFLLCKPLKYINRYMNDEWEDIIDFMFDIEDRLDDIVRLHNAKVITPSQLKKLIGYTNGR
tara:strand:+ start:1213 stop:1464 length:252 start_codon:yes stop_codon:yes gene_type:complete